MSRTTGILIWTLLLLGAGNFLSAQVRGVVRDAESGDSLAFAYILSQNGQLGCFSGINGGFKLNLIDQRDSIKISLLGYVPQTIAVENGRFYQINLQPGGVSIGDVVINPKENPALRIMRNAVAQRGKNDPLNFENFSFATYNKLTATPLYPPGSSDSLRLKIHIFLSETVTQRHQIRPGKVQEQIVSARLAGYPGKVIPFTASDLQDLSFYTNYVGVFGQQFLSPISTPGLNQYRFALVDTMISGEDSIFTIDFEPRNQTFDGFKGSLRLHSKAWALLTADVTLVPNEGGLLIASGQIKQVYQALDSLHWAPSELFTEINTKPLSKGDPFNFHFSGYSKITAASLDDSLKRKFRSEDALVIRDGAGLEDSLLKQGRSIPLNTKDLESYQKLDSLGQKFGLPKLLDQSWKLADNRLGLGVVDLLLDRLITQNRVEKTRLGLGLVTNERISRRFSVGGFVGWGLADNRAKYGLQLLVTPLKDDRLYFGVSGGDDLVESGFRRIGILPDRGLHQDLYRDFSVRRWYLKEMDYVSSREAFLGFRLPGDLGMRLARRLEQVSPSYTYQFNDSSLFNFDESEILLRWAPGARYTQGQNRRILSRSSPTVLSLRFAIGLQSQSGDYQYKTAGLSLSHKFSAFRGGKGLFLLNAGGNDRSLPRYKMRVFRSNYAKGNFTDLIGAFNTMRYDEFAADQYVDAFLYLSPKLRWLRFGPRIQPQLNFSMAATWGNNYVTTSSLNGQYPIQAPNKFYLEPGITITRLLPEPKSPSVISEYIRNIGIGLYYRAGAYTLPSLRENLAFRLSLRGF